MHRLVESLSASAQHIRGSRSANATPHQAYARHSATCSQVFRSGTSPVETPTAAGPSGDHPKWVAWLRRRAQGVRVPLAPSCLGLCIVNTRFAVIVLGHVGRPSFLAVFLPGRSSIGAVVHRSSSALVSKSSGFGVRRHVLVLGCVAARRSARHRCCMRRSDDAGGLRPSLSIPRLPPLQSSWRAISGAWPRFALDMPGHLRVLPCWEGYVSQIFPPRARGAVSECRSSTETDKLRVVVAVRKLLNRTVKKIA